MTQGTKDIITDPVPKTTLSIINSNTQVAPCPHTVALMSNLQLSFLTHLLRDLQILGDGPSLSVDLLDLWAVM